MVVGIVLGLVAASCQSISYLFSRIFVGKFNRSALHLLTLSHVIMAVFSLILFPFLRPETMPPFQIYAFALGGSAFFYLLAQGCLFLTLEKSTASRASPLLGLKVFILALISVMFFNKDFTMWQWAAVAMSVCAAIVLNWSGGSMPWECLLWILLACMGYAMSDISIKSLVDHFAYLGLSHSSSLSVCLCYIVCGTVSLIILWFLPGVTGRMWVNAMPFSIAWFAAMLFLFACFGSIGVVFGNIVQSTRGLISILLGSWVASAGFIHVEDQLTGGVLARRFGAGCLMASAIALFYLGA